MAEAGAHRLATCRPLHRNPRRRPLATAAPARTCASDQRCSPPALHHQLGPDRIRRTQCSSSTNGRKNDLTVSWSAASSSADHDAPPPYCCCCCGGGGRALMRPQQAPIHNSHGARLALVSIAQDPGWTPNLLATTRTHRIYDRRIPSKISTAYPQAVARKLNRTYSVHRTAFKLYSCTMAY